MQITNVTGVKEAGEKKQSGILRPVRKRSREEEAVRDAEVSKEVQEKMRQEAEGATVAISAEGLGLVKKEEAKENASVREQNEKQMYQEMLENTKEAAEAQGESYKDLAKALEIARRILNGDIVPAQDEKFLMEFNSEIYMRVKSMAEQKEDPKEYDSLLEEEEEEDNGKSGKKNSSIADKAPGTEAAQADGETVSSDENA